MSDASAPGFEEWADALAEGGFYLACSNGHGSLPPRRVCPECGETDLAREPLPASGEIETFTEVHVAAPAFLDETPYVTAIADFGPVRLTGVLRDVDAADVSIGDPVEPDVTEHAETGERLVVLRPR